MSFPNRLSEESVSLVSHITLDHIIYSLEELPPHMIELFIYSLVEHMDIEECRENVINLLKHLKCETATYEDAGLKY